MSDNLDWRDMFKRYMDGVGRAEGVYFSDMTDWSPEERGAVDGVIEELRAEGEAEWQRQREWQLASDCQICGSPAGKFCVPAPKGRVPYWFSNRENANLHYERGRP